MSSPGVGRHGRESAAWTRVDRLLHLRGIGLPPSASRTGGARIKNGPGTEPAGVPLEERGVPPGEHPLTPCGRSVALRSTQIDTQRERLRPRDGRVAAKQRGVLCGVHRVEAKRARLSSSSTRWSGPPGGAHLAGERRTFLPRANFLTKTAKALLLRYRRSTLAPV